MSTSISRYWIHCSFPCGDKDLLARYDRLQAAYEAGGGYEIETRLEKICAGLGIERAFRDKNFADLSGGEKTRINLARLILVDTEILLLDEPTNHLDLNATVWLEDYISHYKGTVLVISHDRYFLDRTISRVVELKNGRAEFYAGNYSFYAVEKERRYLEQLRQYKKEQAEIQRLSETARIMHEHNTEHLNKRAFSIEKRIARLNQTARPEERKKLKAKFGQAEFHADDLLSLREVNKAFGSQVLFDHVTLRVEDGDRIALLGDNGAGKSTLAKLLARRLGFLYVDTGAIYRTVGLRAYRAGVDPEDEAAVTALLDGLDIELKYGADGLQHMYLDGEDVTDAIRQHVISRYTSGVSAIPAVRAFLLERQRDMAREHDVIMDGRDIGTVVLPGADVKIFLTASPEDRARRRFDELRKRGQEADYDTVLRDIILRDEHDTRRSAAPLRQAEDALLVDTTGNSLDESLDVLLETIKERLKA